jgi:hypothetical protein
MTDKQISKSNTLALFNMIRIIEDWFINKSFIFSIILLPIDIAVLAAVLLSRFERFISHKIISGFLQYLHYDLTILRELSYMVVRKEYISEELTKDQTEGETKLEGKAFKRVQYVFRFIWSLIIFLVTFPLLPLLWLWDFLAPELLVGLLYYLILFNDLNIVLSIFLFSIATFLVATLTVPWIFGAYVIIKNMLSLERKSYAEIKWEAETFFIKLYRYQFDEQEDEETTEEERGGVYYLFLKVLHTAKDQSLGILRSISRKRSTQHLMEKLRLGKIREELLKELNDRHPINPKDLLVPLFGFIFTFLVALVMVYAGTKGEGILGSVMISVVDGVKANEIWFNLNSQGIGYIEHFLVLSPILSNILGFLGFITDQFFGYLFIVWHGIIPYYFDFTLWYYSQISNLFINAVS